MYVDRKKLKNALEQIPEIAAVYLFGSAVENMETANDLDLLVLLEPQFDFLHIHLTLVEKISTAVQIKPDLIDLLSFDLNLADPEVLYRAITTGVLLKNKSPQFLSDKIEALSRYFLENEYLIQEEKRLQKERLEAFCAD